MLAQAVGARARLQQGSAARAPCLSGILDAIKASSLLDPDKSRLYRHAVGAALQRPLTASGTAASPAVPCCEQREDCELEAILVALGTFQGKDNANITEAKAWLRQSQQPQMASRVGRLAETRNGKAHPDVTLTATSRPSSAAGPAKSKSLLEFLFSNSHYSARSIRCCKQRIQQPCRSTYKMHPPSISNNIRSYSMGQIHPQQQRLASLMRPFARRSVIKARLMSLLSCCKRSSSSKDHVARPSMGLLESTKMLLPSRLRLARRARWSGQGWPP